MGIDIVALTPLESEALDELRWKKLLTLRHAFSPDQLVPTSGDYVYGLHLGDPSQFTWPSILGLIPWVRYNRVDGVLFGGLRSFPYGENMILSARIGQSLNLGRRQFTTSEVALGAPF